MHRGKVLAFLVVALTGCDLMDLDVYRCSEPDKGHKDANGQPDPCHRNDPTASDAGSSDDAGGTCVGQCAPGLPIAWNGPSLVWIGAEAAAPPCPENASLQVFTGHAELDAPFTCGACKCDAPIGSCDLPATLTASSAVCPGNGSGVAHTSFDPPAGWGETCTAANAIPAGKLCGGVPCVQSVTIAPLTLKQGGCLPIEAAKVQPTPTWKTFARACSTDTNAPTCGTKSGVCAPISPGPEFKVCTLKEGDPTKLDCPLGYPDRSVFYYGFEDDRICSPCVCGAPSGSTCTGSISIFQDGACGAPLVVSLALDAIGPKCDDVSPGSALGSKSASESIFTPGTCQADGGKSNGKALPDGATVICCLGTP
jgi:hypothetical protein